MVTFKGEGKSFCSGGDLKSHMKNWKTKSHETLKNLDDHMRTEFSLQYYLAHMRPLQVAIMHGYIMGGGTCLTTLAPIRIVTETAKFSMPEGKIGFFVDCCASYYFPTFKNKLGFYLATTGKIIEAQQMVYLNLADYLVESNKIKKVEQELVAFSKNLTIKTPKDKLTAYQ